MEYTIVWPEGGAEDVRLETVGPVDVDALDAMTEALLADPRFRPNLRILVDHTRARWSVLRPDEVRRRAELVHAQAPRIGTQRIAFVVDGRVDLGIARLLTAYTAGDVEFDARVFATVAAAREWLVVAEPGGMPEHRELDGVATEEQRDSPVDDDAQLP